MIDWWRIFWCEILVAIIIKLMPIFMIGDFIDLVADQQYFDMFHISFIVYDLDEEELLLWNK